MMGLGASRSTNAPSPGEETQGNEAFAAGPDVGRGSDATVARRRRSVRLVSLVVTVLVVASLVLQLTGSPLAQEEDTAAAVLLSAAFTLVGGAIAARLPGNAFGWVVLAVGALGAVAAISGSSSGPPVVRWLGYWSWWLPYGLLPVTLLLFPTGRLPSRRWRPAVGLTAIGLIVPAVCLVAARSLHPDPLGMFGPPASGSAETWLLFARIGGFAAALALLASLASLAVRWRAAEDYERRQVLCLGIGGAALFLGLLLSALNVAGAWVAGALAVPLAAGAAILRHRLYDLDLVINRSLVYLGLSASLLAAYAGVVWLGDHLLDQALPVEPPLVAAAVIALGLHPLRRRLQRGVDRLLYGNRSDPYAVVSALGQRLESPTDPDTVLADVAEAVAENLALPYVAIELGSPGGGGHRRVEWGRRAGEPLSLPLSHRGEPVGHLVVSTRTIGGTFTKAERRLLEDLARQVALTAHAVQLSADLLSSREKLVVALDELRNSRARLVEAGDAERRRIERDLHDGAQQRLVSLLLNLKLARRQAVGAPGASDRSVDETFLDAVEAELTEALHELRTLASGILPPVLTDRGLGAAVEELRSRSPIPVEIEQMPPQRLPERVEVAAYFVVSEALANVVKHAGANRVRVRVAQENGRALVEITDDGVGGVKLENGSGLRGLADRVGALEGRLELDSPAGRGTTVRAEIPCA